MAHIVRFKIDGLLGRKKQLVANLDRAANVFFGENGCGKTTLLKILQSAMQRDSDVMQNLAVERAEVDIYSVAADGIIKHVWERKALNQSERLIRKRLSLPDGVDISRLDIDFIEKINAENTPWVCSGAKLSKEFARSRWSHAYLPTTRLYNYERIKRPTEVESSAEERINEAFADEINRKWLTYSSQVLNEVKDIQEEGLRAALYHSLSLPDEVRFGPSIDPKRAFARVKNFLSRQNPIAVEQLGSLKKFIQRYETDEGLRKVVENINNVEDRIEQAMKPIHKLSSTINGLFSNGKKIELDSTGLQVDLGSGSKISPARLSSGEKHLLTILLNAMTIGESSIIIDEPELSMHIDWQHVLIETINILNPECQLIVASHSPEIMANIREEQIFRI